MTECDPITCLDAGADDCVPPTVRPEELVCRLRAVARRGASRHRVVRVHDLVIDAAVRRVERGGRRIDLTGREYEVLAFLAAHRGEVMSRAVLCRRVFDQHPADASNIVAVYIRSLRRKIDAGFGTPLVLTHWGRGYRLRDEDEEAGPDRA